MYTLDDCRRADWDINTYYAPPNIKDQLIDAPLWWHTRGLQQTASGYGWQLTTRFKVPFAGRNRRVYATHYSNAATLWVKLGKVRVIIH